MTKTSRPAILILAAGASSRMRGRDKLMEPVGGRPLIARQVCAACATGARVIVALPPDGGARAAAIADKPVETTAVADAAEGMGRSIAAGARTAASASGLMVVPADMALIGAEAMRKMLSYFETAPDRIWRGMTPEGVAGHPVVFPARVFPALEALHGDRGARDVLSREAALMVPLPGRTAVLDLDTPEDWAAFRATGET